SEGGDGAELGLRAHAVVGGGAIAAKRPGHPGARPAIGPRGEAELRGGLGTPDQGVAAEAREVVVAGEDGVGGHHRGAGEGALPLEPAGGGGAVPGAGALVLLERLRE